LPVKSGDEAREAPVANLRINLMLFHLGRC
jgi:hypothetical protein